jgi:hypothetical protein
MAPHSARRRARFPSNPSAGNAECRVPDGMNERVQLPFLG